jgi:hypothetical protein
LRKKQTHVHTETCLFFFFFCGAGDET